MARFTFRGELDGRTSVEVIVRGAKRTILQNVIDAEAEATRHRYRISWEYKRAAEWRGIARPE